MVCRVVIVLQTPYCESTNQTHIIFMVSAGSVLVKVSHLKRENVRKCILCMVDCFLTNAANTIVEKYSGSFIIPVVITFYN